MILDICKQENIDSSLFKIVNNENELKSISQAVDMVNGGEADILMKGLCSTDKYMRGILNKERGPASSEGCIESCVSYSKSELS